MDRNNTFRGNGYVLSWRHLDGDRFLHVLIHDPLKEFEFLGSLDNALHVQPPGKRLGMVMEHTEKISTLSQKVVMATLSILRERGIETTWYATIRSEDLFAKSQTDEKRDLLERAGSKMGVEFIYQRVDSFAEAETWIAGKFRETPDPDAG